ncbi:MAG: DUF6763 family protein [Sulfuricaulis sp.]|uniref:DUF6763 family protein n=1 Tax=Sulfuricaulis sp. TaxID=2003553 RepID=UPI003C5E182F
MTTALKPVISQWYRHRDKGQQFYVTALDEEAGTVETQHFDGDLEEMDFDDWHQQSIEAIEPPEDWTGPVDNIARDDLGYSETDMTSEDWQEPLEEKVQAAESEEEEELHEE